MMPPPVMMQKPAWVLVMIYLFWCFSRLMFFYLRYFCTGLLLLLTDLDCTLLLKPLELTSLVMSYFERFTILIFVLRLNSPVVLVSSVRSLSWEIGFEMLVTYFFRSWFTVLGYSQVAGLSGNFDQLRMQLLEESFLRKSSSLSPSKQGCFRASTAVRRSAGFILSSCLRKCSPLGGNLPKYLLSMDQRLCMSGNFIPKNLGFFRKVQQWSEIKGPRHFCMRKSWSNQFSPGNIGFPSISYPKMQPTAQISISLEQLAPTNNSGGRYHRVATQSVSSYSEEERLSCLAKPKSQILSSFLSLISRFSGLISLCTMFKECMQAKPLSSWYMRNLMISGSSPSGDFYSTSSRLFCTYQKTRQTMPFLRKASLSSTMVWCFSILSILTSLMVVFLTISSSSDSLNFLMATISLFQLHLHLSTTPQAPYPISPKISYFCIITYHYNQSNESQFGLIQKDTTTSELLPYCHKSIPATYQLLILPLPQTQQYLMLTPYKRKSKMLLQLIAQGQQALQARQV